jgi:hypothetical protein
MHVTPLDRRTAIKITLAGVSAVFMAPGAQTSETLITHTTSMQPCSPPSMCAELHIEDVPSATHVND